MEQTFEVPPNQFVLERVPANARRPLRAWDAADAMAVEALADLEIDEGGLVIVGDRFGALTCALRQLNPVVASESAAAREAISANLLTNGLAPVETQSVLDGFDRNFSAAVIRVPKARNELIDTLHRLRPHLDEGAVVVGAAMDKHLERSFLDCFNELVGPAELSRASRKARLITARLDASLDPGPSPWPVTWRAHGATLFNHGSGFSPTKLDVGTDLLLRSLDENVDEWTAIDQPRIVDLGCGNGIVGIRLATALAAAGAGGEVVAIDDDASALDAATRSWAASIEPETAVSVSYRHHHRLVEVCEPASVDLVVVNPPFHDDRVVGDETAWSMFVDSHNVLKPGGSLVVVGNRHLGYHAKLAKIFGNSDTLTSNAKFVVLRSQR